LVLVLELLEGEDDLPAPGGRRRRRLVLAMDCEGQDQCNKSDLRRIAHVKIFEF